MRALIVVHWIFSSGTLLNQWNCSSWSPMLELPQSLNYLKVMFQYLTWMDSDLNILQKYWEIYPHFEFTWGSLRWGIKLILFCFVCMTSITVEIFEIIVHACLCDGWAIRLMIVICKSQPQRLILKQSLSKQCSMNWAWNNAVK